MAGLSESRSPGGSDAEKQATGIGAERQPKSRLIQAILWVLGVGALIPLGMIFEAGDSSTLLLQFIVLGWMILPFALMSLAVVRARLANVSLWICLVGALLLTASQAVYILAYIRPAGAQQALIILPMPLGQLLWVGIVLAVAYVPFRWNG